MATHPGHLTSCKRHNVREKNAGGHKKEEEESKMVRICKAGGVGTTSLFPGFSLHNEGLSAAAAAREAANQIATFRMGASSSNACLLSRCIRGTRQRKVPFLFFVFLAISRSNFVELASVETRYMPYFARKTACGSDYAKHSASRFNSHQLISCCVRPDRERLRRHFEQMVGCPITRPQPTDPHTSARVLMRAVDAARPPSCRH